jgi:SnoaL-like domain
MKTVQVAEAFSSHRFAEIHDDLADDVRWVLVGQASIEGKQAVVAACDASAAEMARLEHAEFARFVAVGNETVAAVDAIGRYVGADGDTSIVSSCDIYEFDGDGRVITITSYAVELEGER